MVFAALQELAQTTHILGEKAYHDYEVGCLQCEYQHVDEHAQTHILSEVCGGT